MVRLIFRRYLLTASYGFERGNKTPESINAAGESVGLSGSVDNRRGRLLTWEDRIRYTVHDIF